MIIIICLCYYLSKNVREEDGWVYEEQPYEERKEVVVEEVVVEHHHPPHYYPQFNDNNQ